MSVDLFSTPGLLRPYPPDTRVRARLGNSLPGPVRHVVVIFGGWGSSAAGQPLRPVPGQPTGTSELLKSVQALGDPPLGTLHVTAFEGSLMFAQGIQQAEAFIRSHFHPLGRLIIYGYSAGGPNAINLASRISMWRYDFAPPRALTCCGPLPGVGIVRVDLLVTVDAADGPMSSLLDRHISSSVRRNMNFYQTYPASRPRCGGATASGVRSHGGPAYAANPTATLVENHDLTALYTADPGQGHGRIDNDTNEAVLEATRGTLFGYEGSPRLLANGMMALP